MKPTSLDQAWTIYLITCEHVHVVPMSQDLFNVWFDANQIRILAMEDPMFYVTGKSGLSTPDNLVMVPATVHHLLIKHSRLLEKVTLEFPEYMRFFCAAQTTAAC